MHHSIPGGWWRQAGRCRGDGLGLTGLNRAIGLLPASEAGVRSPGRGDHRSEPPVAAGEEGLDHAPAIAFRPELDAPGFEALRQQFEPLLSLRPHSVPLEGRVGLGHEGAHPQGKPQARGGLLQVQQQGGGGFDVGLLLARKTGHPIELQAAEPPFAGVAGRGEDLLGGELLVHHLPHPLAAALERDRERFAAALGQDPPQLGRHGGGPHRTHAQPHALEAIAIEPGQQIGELRVLGHRGAKQAEPLGGGQPHLHRWDQAVLQGGGAEGEGEVTGQAEAAQLRAAAHHLHHVDRGPGGLRGDHRGVAEGVAAPGLLADLIGDAGLGRFNGQQHSIAAVAGCVEGRHIHPLHPGQAAEPLGPGLTPAGLQGVHKGWQQLFSIPQQHGVEEGCQGLGIGREHRPTAEHDRVVVTPLVAPDRDALILQEIEEHRAIQLPAQGEPEQFGPSPPVPVRGIPPVGEEPPHIHIGAAGQGGPHHLISQAGDAHPVGAREGQHHPQGVRRGPGGLKQQGFLVQGWKAGASSVSPRPRLAPEPSQKKARRL